MFTRISNKTLIFNSNDLFLAKKRECSLLKSCFERQSCYVLNGDVGVQLSEPANEFELKHLATVEIRKRKMPVNF